jgi:hypothetical protein
MEVAMMACSDFRAQFQAGTDDAALLRHLRTCDPCLDYAAHSDPDVMFRAIGGDEIVPPGGVDAFVADVMHTVRLRGAEGVIAPPASTWHRRLAIAATLAIGISGASLVYQVEHRARVAPAQSVAAVRHPVEHQITLTTKPAVQAYSSSNATIVEVPSETPNDNTQIVMIVDENLPADL